MNCHPGRWLWGLIPVAMLTLIAVIGEYRGIQDDLRARVGQHLSTAGVEFAATGFTGRDGRLIANALDADERRRAMHVARNVWGVRMMEAQVLLAAAPKKYVLSALREPASVHLTGYVPTETVRTRIVAMTRSQFPAHSIEDRLIVVRSDEDPAHWIHGAEFAMGQLGRLTSGSRVDLDGHDLVIEGRAGSHRDYKLVRGELSQNLPDGIRLRNGKVLPPVAVPYLWSASYGKDQLELKGHVPSEEQRNELFAHSKRIFPRATIIDRMTIASGEPRKWQVAVMRVLTQLGTLESGKVVFEDNRISFAGAADQQRTAGAASQALKAQVPASFEITEQITFRTPDIPIIKPYVTEIELTESTSKMKGFAPSRDARARLASAVKAASKTNSISNELKLGAGADKGWLPCLKAGIEGLAKIGGGKLVLTDRRLQLSGQTFDESLISETTLFVRAAANRACDLTANIVLMTLPEPDLKWSATLSSQGLTLEGEVPDAITKQKIHSRAREIFSGVKILDLSEVKTSLSAKWSAVALAGLGSLAKLRSGRAIIDGQHLNVSGQAPDTVTASAVRDALKRNTPFGYTATNTIEVRSAAMLWADQEAKRKAAEARRRKDQSEPKTNSEKTQQPKNLSGSGTREPPRESKQTPEVKIPRESRQAKHLEQPQEPPDDATQEPKSNPKQVPREQREVVIRNLNEAKGKHERERDCQDAVRSAMQRARIRFDRASAAIGKKSYAALDRVISAVETCPEAFIEIEGHADSDGNAANNMRLSRRRATAVLRYFERAGIPGERLNAIGYGETRPLLPNTTKANKARNRRIDFRIKIN